MGPSWNPSTSLNEVVQIDAESARESHHDQENSAGKMTRLFRRWTAAFSVVQLCGLAAMWIWPHARVAAAILWGAALIALFPGNIISTTLIERMCPAFLARCITAQC